MDELSRNGIDVELPPVLRTPEELRSPSPLLPDLTEDAVILKDRRAILAAALGCAPRLGGDAVVSGLEARLRSRRDFRDMTSVSLARSYFEKAHRRLRALETLLEDEACSGVIREAQELVSWC